MGLAQEPVQIVELLRKSCLSWPALLIAVTALLIGIVAFGKWSRSASLDTVSKLRVAIRRERVPELRSQPKIYFRVPVEDGFPLVSGYPLSERNVYRHVRLPRIEDKGAVTNKVIRIGREIDERRDYDFDPPFVGAVVGHSSNRLQRTAHVGQGHLRRG
jgi:hypothetical protein